MINGYGLLPSDGENMNKLCEVKITGNRNVLRE
jgi:hypothetical protein